MVPQYGVFCYYCAPGLLWFRVFGVGLLVKDVTRHRLLFSEREGFVWHLWVGHWFVRWLWR